VLIIFALNLLLAQYLSFFPVSFIGNYVISRKIAFNHKKPDMKRTIALGLLIGALLTSVWGQKVGYVNTDLIMNKMKEYKEAQTEIDRFSTEWQSQLEEYYAEVERLYTEYTAIEVLLEEDDKEAKQAGIFAKERQAKEYREEKFGYNGALFRLQEAKVRPIQDKVISAVKVVAKRKKFAMVYDKAGESTWLYTDPAYDLSDEVSEELGLNDEKKNN
jgi:outer membrane protein